MDSVAEDHLMVIWIAMWAAAYKALLAHSHQRHQKSHRIGWLF